MLLSYNLINSSAFLPVDTVNASGAIPARIAVAFVDVDFAIVACSSSIADALISVN